LGSEPKGRSKFLTDEIEFLAVRANRFNVEELAELQLGTGIADIPRVARSSGFGAYDEHFLSLINQRTELKHYDNPPKPGTLAFCKALRQEM
jgi:hypothetical protein